MAGEVIYDCLVPNHDDVVCVSDDPDRCLRGLQILALLGVTPPGTWWTTQEIVLAFTLPTNEAMTRKVVDSLIQLAERGFLASHVLRGKWRLPFSIPDLQDRVAVEDWLDEEAVS